MIFPKIIKIYGIGVVFFFLQRILYIFITALGVATLTFFLIHLTPGDPIEVILGEHALAADREALRQTLGLNLPLWEQYSVFIQNLSQHNLGTSLYTGQEVSSMISSRFPATAKLAALAMTFAIITGLFFGLIAAEFKDKFPDKFTLLFSMLGFAMPSFWLGPLLIIVFSLWLGIFPISGDDGFKSMVLPAITLGLAMAAFTGRLTRNTLLEALSQDYIRTAKAKSCSKIRILFQHALPNAMLPIITVIFLQIGALLTGAIITEAVFSWPGVGSLIVDSLNRRDYPVIQGCVIFISFTYMAMTLLSDIIYAVLDPRVRYGEKA
jgi:peptide/nickel transport system permease protein